MKASHPRHTMRLLSAGLLAIAVLLGSRHAAALSPDQDWNSSSDSPVTVVFIHGVLGDPITTFGPSTARSWPGMLASDPASTGGAVRVISVGYTSSPIGRGSNITEIANRLLVKLTDKQIFEPGRKVIVIAHSMGGLIAKRMLVQLAADSPEAFKSVAGVFFLATPSGGSDLANVARWMSGNPQFGDMRPEEFNTYLQTIEDDWQSLLRRRAASRYPRAYCAYEKIGVGPGKVVVPHGRAQSGCDETPLAIDKDHIAIVKPSGTGDEVYQWVANRIKRIRRSEGIAMNVTVAVTDARGVELPEPYVMGSRNGYAIQVSLSKPGWIYVFVQDSSNKIERYFPTAAAGGQDGARSSFKVPSIEGKAFILDDRAGVERIFVVATSEKSERLAKLYSEVGAKVSTPRRAALLHSELVKRGATVDDVSGATSPPLAKLKAGSLGGDGVATLMIEHR